MQYSAEFEVKLATWLEGAQEIVDKNYENSTFHPKLSLERGKKFIKIVRADYPGEEIGGHAAHCFIDSTNGDVLKSASWKAPAKHARGNIFAEDNGLGCMGPYGAAYLRG